MATTEQRRAQHAYDKVSKHEGNTAEDQKKYKSFATGFPALIHQCGLAQAIAYAQNKAPDKYLDDLADVLQTNVDELTNQVRTAQLSSYQRYTRATLSAATWLKRYAEALLKKEKVKEAGNA